MDLSRIYSSTASFSRCGRYRYTLSRRWQADGPKAIWIMLNPSTADRVKNDPTVRRCIGYSFDWGFSGLVVLNIFAWRATLPQELYQTSDPVGPRNDAAIRRSIREMQPGGKIICAWGDHGFLHDRHHKVLNMIRKLGAEPHYLKMNQSGAPSHPLYLRKTLEPVLM